jgi:hypothetical protein
MEEERVTALGDLDDERLGEPILSEVLLELLAEL